MLKNELFVFFKLRSFDQIFKIHIELMMELRVLILHIVFLLINVKDNNCTWDYERLGPDVWSYTYPHCAGESQSPVNIKTACTIQENFQKFNFMPNYNQSFNFTLKNDGHTITAKYNGPPLFINGANLDGNFQFVNFHLHWGPNENVGSEHQMYVFYFIP